MSNIAIQADNIGKMYRIGRKQAEYRTLREAITETAVAPFRRAHSILTRSHPTAAASDDNDRIWALKDVSFEVRAGEVVGIIGRNGAGKSTLLKVLSRVTEPTEGQAEIHGRIGSLLEVGTGFHPELTGRENIFLNGAILGMKRDEIRRKFDEIVEFAGVERFIDTPVKHYSSGMYLRLAFAVAAHLETEILLVDEVLAVGDAQFQQKCLGRMQSVAQAGRTVLFISHDMGAIRRLCRWGFVLNEGKVEFSGQIKDAVEFYLGSLAKPGGWKQTESNQPFHFVSVRVIDQKGKEENRFSLGSEVVLEIRAEAHEQLASSHVAVLVRFEGSPLFLSFDTDDFPDCLLNRPAGTVTYHLKINTGHLKPGRYDVRLNTGVQRRPAFEVLDNVVWFELYDQDGDFDRSWARDRGGVMKCPGKWMLA